MADLPLILASSSPRRRELLARLEPAFEIIPSTLEEPTARSAATTPLAWASALAYFKARSVADRHARRIVLGADTIVAVGAELLGKPRDVVDARRMLELQAGAEARVITGVALVRVSDARVHRIISAAETRVWMRDDSREREAYLASGDWHGKAGAYGIQDVGDRLVDSIDGEFENVVGLPLGLLRKLHAAFCALFR